jgi:predicted LPLAT superfamily acyltransferase
MNTPFANRDAPQTGASPASTAPSPAKDVGSKTGMKLLAFFMRFFPRPVVYWIALFPVVWYYLFRPEGRRSSNLYQRKIGLTHGPIGRFFFGLGQARAFSQVILDNMYLGMFGPSRFNLSLIGTEVFLRALSHGKGLILLSAHVGNWHLALNFLSNTHARVHLVTDEARQAEVRRQMDLAKENADHLVVHSLSKGMDLIFELRAFLNRGEVVILGADRVTGGRKTKADFFGSQASFPTTAYALAKISGAPVCTAFSFRTGMQRYSCYGVGPFWIKTNDDVEQTVQAFAGSLEKHLQQFPQQWFNFFDFWKR